MFWVYIAAALTREDYSHGTFHGKISFIHSIFLIMMFKISYLLHFEIMKRTNDNEWREVERNPPEMHAMKSLLKKILWSVSYTCHHLQRKKVTVSQTILEDINNLSCPCEGLKKMCHAFQDKCYFSEETAAMMLKRYTYRTTTKIPLLFTTHLATAQKCELDKLGLPLKLLWHNLFWESYITIMPHVMWLQKDVTIL